MSPTPPLHRALDRLAEVLPTKDVARRWFDRCVIALGARAVVETSGAGALVLVHRRAADGSGVLPLPALRWTRRRGGGPPLEGFDLHDGHQRLSLLYLDDGTIGERSINALHRGHLVELTRVLRSDDAEAASVSFVARLTDENFGPARIHYPTPAPGGVACVWSAARAGCRRALYDGRIEENHRFVVADGIAGTAIGVGHTLEEALDGFASAVRECFPEPDDVMHSITDDYDDDGNLIARGEPPELPDAGAAEADSGEDALPWREVAPPPSGAGEDAPAFSFMLGPFHIRGPRSDSAPIPRRADCVPYAVVPIEPLPKTSPPRGRWVKMIGQAGATRYAVRIEDPMGYTLVGADLLGLVDLRGLGPLLDDVDRRHRGPPMDPGIGTETDRYVRYRARWYRWHPGGEGEAPAEGLRVAGGSQGPRFDASGLDGDALQGMVCRHRKVLRPSD